MSQPTAVKTADAIMQDLIAHKFYYGTNEEYRCYIHTGSGYTNEYCEDLISQYKKCYPKGTETPSIKYFVLCKGCDLTSLKHISNILRNRCQVSYSANARVGGLNLAIESHSVLGEIIIIGDAIVLKFYKTAAISAICAEYIKAGGKANKQKGAIKK